MDIKLIIDNEIQNLLLEGLSDIIYHFTHIHNIINILKTNKINTSSNIGTQSDAQKDKGRFFYFSTQRSKGKSGYGYHHNSNAVLVLDGRKLMQKYKGFPTDYWNWSMSRKDYDDNQSYIEALRSKEMEDRIITDKPYIESASDYILEIHINISNPWYVKKKELFELQELSKRMTIPIYFYQDQDNYQLQNKSKAIDLNNIDNGFKADDEKEYVSAYRHFYHAFTTMMPYILYQTKHENRFWKLLYQFLESKGESKRYDEIKAKVMDAAMKVYKFYQNDRYKDWYHMEDKYRSIEADFHNEKSSSDPFYREFLRILVQDIRDTGATNLKQYFIKKLGLRTS